MAAVRFLILAAAPSLVAATNSSTLRYRLQDMITEDLLNEHLKGDLDLEKDWDPLDCASCDAKVDFEIARVWALEWGVFPTFSPFPNPMHAFDYVPAPGLFKKKDGSEYSPNSLWSEAVVFKRTIFRCTACVFCKVWSMFKSVFSALWNGCKSVGNRLSKLVGSISLWSKKKTA